MNENKLLLVDCNPLIVIPELAKIIGLNEAIILQQMHSWIEFNKEKEQNFYQNTYWTRQTYEQWQEQFPFWNLLTVKRIIKSLENKGLIIAGNFNKKGYDRTRWYTINYEKIKEIVDISTKYQNVTMDSIKMLPWIVTECYDGKYQNDIMDSNKILPPIQEINKEINEEIKKEKKKKHLLTNDIEIKDLINNSSLSTPLKEVLTEWVDYKTERKEKYQLTGFKKLLTIFSKNAEQYGETEVINLVNECMSNNWKGIIWDKLKANKKTSSNDDLLEMIKNGEFDKEKKKRNLSNGLDWLV